MAEVKVTAPAVIKLKNTSKLAKRFVPYKENFTVVVPVDGVVEFEVKTSGQVLYYLAQATEGLEVSNLTNFDGEVTLKVNTPAKITLTNTSDRVIGFIPYKENFQYNVAKGDKVELTAETVGQTLYYLAQATDGLTVTQVAVE